MEEVTVKFQTKREARQFMEWMDNSGEQGFSVHMNMQEEDFSHDTSVPSYNRYKREIYYSQPEQLIQKIENIKSSLVRRKDQYDKQDINDWCDRFNNMLSKKSLPENLEEQVKAKIREFRRSMF